MFESTHFEIQPRPCSPAPIAVPARRASQAGVKMRLAAPVFAVTSGKGGVGKTNVVANLAIALSRLNKRVLAIDADPSARAFAGLAEKLLQRTAERVKVKGTWQFFFRRMSEAEKAER